MNLPEPVVHTAHPARRRRARTLPEQRLLTRMGHDLSRLLDAHGEALNNVARNEADFLRDNLRACRMLARRIERRTAGKRLRLLLAAAEKEVRR